MNEGAVYTVKMIQPKKRKLSRQLLLGCLAFTIVLSLLIGFASYFIFQKGMMSQYEARLQDILSLTMARIDVEDLESCMQTGTESETLQELFAYMDDVRQNCSFEYLVIVQPVKTEDGYDVIAVGSGLLPEERAGADLKAISVPRLGDSMKSTLPADLIPQLYEDMRSREGFKYQSTSSDYGTTFDASITIRKSNGEGIALLTAGLMISEMNASLLPYFIITLFSAGIIGVIFMILINLWLNRRIVVPLNKIEEAASAFAAKSREHPDPDQLIMQDPDVHTGDELESLSDTLISMAEDMRSYIGALLASTLRMRDMKREMEEITDNARKDPLTGLRNKAAFNEDRVRLENEIDQRHAAFAVLMIDLNGLKQINDAYGHDKGDIYLRNNSDAICNVFVHSPIYRVGGDEFIVLLEKRDYLERERLCSLLKCRMVSPVAGREWESVSAAMGMAVYGEVQDDTLDAVIKRADLAMYENKKQMKQQRTIA